MWRVGKKTALLQAEASACVLGLANVLFCVKAVHFSCPFAAKYCCRWFFFACA